jgi:hypothetical protein
MEEEPDTRKAAEQKHSFNWGFIVWPLAVLLLYFLSLGPVLIMTEKSHILPDNKFVATFYAPLWWAYWKTPLHKPLGMYLHFWAPRWYESNGDLNVYQ